MQQPRAGHAQLLPLALAGAPRGGAARPCADPPPPNHPAPGSHRPPSGCDRLTAAFAALQATPRTAPSPRPCTSHPRSRQPAVITAWLSPQAALPQQHSHTPPPLHGAWPTPLLVVLLLMVAVCCRLCWCALPYNGPRSYAFSPVHSATELNATASGSRRWMTRILTRMLTHRPILSCTFASPRNRWRGLP